jgi:hypothetical protein
MKKLTYLVIAMIVGNVVANKVYAWLWGQFGD